MRIFRGFNAAPPRERVVTLGVFDGLHVGHVRILDALRTHATRLGVSAAVITFDDHPHGTLNPKTRPPQLSLAAQRLVRFRELGIDELFLVRFTQRLADTLPEAFVRTILVARLRVRHVVVGQDFVFGRGGQGTLAVLKTLGKKYGFGVTVVPAKRAQGTIISSTGIRTWVAQGEVKTAHRWLGWPYALHGTVVHGEGLGSTFGLPTANVKTVHEIVPRPGVYRVRAHIGKRAWPALCHIGPKPTFHAAGPETIEVHIPGWRGRLYGRKLEVSFYQRIRGSEKFSGIPALKAAIERDWQQVKKAWPDEDMPDRIFKK